MEERTVKIAEPGLTSSDYFSAIMKSIKEVQKKVSETIAQVANNDESIILKIYEGVTIQDEDLLYFETHSFMEPSFKIKENVLLISGALAFTEFAVLSMDEGDINEALYCINEANTFLGAYIFGIHLNGKAVLKRKLRASSAAAKKNKISNYLYFFLLLLIIFVLSRFNSFAITSIVSLIFF